ncbi:MAG: beta-ketoacyl-ACP synthase III [bacterium]
MNQGLRRVGITGTGSYVPDRVMTNDDFATQLGLDTSDEWIRPRTGIRQRHFVTIGEQGTSDLALEASKLALARAGRTAQDIDAIILATVTPDTIFPTTANNLQAKLGCRPVMSFDLLAACSGFLYSMQVGSSLIASGAANCVLVVGAEVMSAILDFTDRATCVLFGDGAGAVILEAVPTGGLEDSVLRSDGCKGNILHMPAGGSLKPASHATVDAGEHYVLMEGREVYKFAVQNMREVALELLSRNGMTADDLDFVIVHQANINIIDSCLKKLGIPIEKTWINIDRLGNTTAGTIPICIDEAWRAGKLKPGDRVMLLSFGAGVTWGAVLLEWSLAMPEQIEVFPAFEAASV